MSRLYAPIKTADEAKARIERMVKELADAGLPVTTEENISTETAIEAVQKAAQKKRGVDAVARIESLPEERQEKIEAGAGKIMVSLGMKTKISLYVDTDALKAFKAMGPRYQTRLNNLIRKHVEDNG